jgi:hypothetical protein
MPQSHNGISKIRSVGNQYVKERDARMQGFDSTTYLITYLYISFVD